MFDCILLQIKHMLRAFNEKGRINEAKFSSGKCHTGLFQSPSRPSQLLLCARFFFLPAHISQLDL